MDTSSRYIIAPSFQVLSNWCSMNCSGCGIKTAPIKDGSLQIFKDDYIENAKENFYQIKQALNENRIKYIMVEQTGGEPSLAPQIVCALGEVFNDSIHKIISNGLTTENIKDYILKNKHRIILVISLDHHLYQFNQLRFGSEKKMKLHNKVLQNIECYVNEGVNVVISTIISKFNIDNYVDFIKWLESKYTIQIENGYLVPIPVSLVSFGNNVIGRMNPSYDQVLKLKDKIYNEFNSLTINRIRNWFYKDFFGLYENKHRYFELSEELSNIIQNSSKSYCHIYKSMISFNYQDEEILKNPYESIFDGYGCGVKVLGNIGYNIDEIIPEYDRISEFSQRPNNISKSKKYFLTTHAYEYIKMKDEFTNNRLFPTFNSYQETMCYLDDFDGVWMPFNLFFNEKVSLEELAKFWIIFKNKKVKEFMIKIKNTI